MVRRILKFFSSLKLAVIILLLLAILICIGTIVESRYDAYAAKVFVYNSLWMSFVMGLLVLTLIAVILERWPWKPRHLAFILAHIGVIMIIVGAVITQEKGLDGTVRLVPNEEVRTVVVPETEIVLYRSSTGADFEKVFAEEVQFLKNPVTEKRPFLMKTGDIDIEILESVPYAIPKMSVEASEFSQSGAGLRFQLSNERIHSMEWLVQKNIFEKVNFDMGPVKVSMGGLWERELDRHEIRLTPEASGVRYAFYEKQKAQPRKQGFLEEGHQVATPWMGLNLRILRYFAKAQTKWDIDRLPRPTPQTASALRVRHGKYESWLFVDDYLKVFTEKNVYLLAYSHRRVDLGFPLSLKEFKKIDYQGTSRAMAYQSLVQYGEKKETLISMNEPLKYQGYNFYQASFEELPNSSVKASILSVNYDPGRFLKYLGSLVMCLGIVFLFYFRKHYRKKPL